VDDDAGSARTASQPPCDIGYVAGGDCPGCGIPLEQEHAHTRCRHCGFIGKCCD
jgi:hypothetical protein